MTTDPRSGTLGELSAAIVTFALDRGEYSLPGMGLSLTLGALGLVALVQLLPYVRAAVRLLRR